MSWGGKREALEVGGFKEMWDLLGGFPCFNGLFYNDRGGNQSGGLGYGFFLSYWGSREANLTTRFDSTIEGFGVRLQGGGSWLDVLFLRIGGETEIIWDLPQSWDIDKVQYDGLQFHGYTYGDKYVEVEWFYFIFKFGGSHDVQTIDWILDVPD